MIIPPKVQGLAFVFVELHEVPIDLFLQTFQSPLDGSITLRCTSHCSQFCAICKTAEDTLCPIVQIITKDAKQSLSQGWPLGYAISDLPQIGLHAADPKPLSLAVQLVFSPAHCKLA